MSFLRRRGRWDLGRIVALGGALVALLGIAGELLGWWHEVGEIVTVAGTLASLYGVLHTASSDEVGTLGDTLGGKLDAVTATMATRTLQEEQTEILREQRQVLEDIRDQRHVLEEIRDRLGSPGRGSA